MATLQPAHMLCENVKQNNQSFMARFCRDVMHSKKKQNKKEKTGSVITQILTLPRLSDHEVYPYLTLLC